LRLGCGPHTLAAAWSLNNRPASQATVRDFDEQTSGGTVLLDDGTVLPFGAAAFDGRRLRMLRPGQRVRIAVDVDASGLHVSAVTLATFSLPDR
jgi:2-phospho-L-lactate guanylyltransferase